MKLLEGYVEKRTKEATLAAMMMALFLVIRTYKIVVIPGVLIFDVSNAIIFTSAYLFSWPYSVLFPIITMYGGSNIFGPLAWFVGTQTVFFLSKITKLKHMPYVVAMGDVISNPFYGLLMHFGGLMNFWAFAWMTLPVQVIQIVVAFIGAQIIWKVLTRLKIIESPLETS